MSEKEINEIIKMKVNSNGRITIPAKFRKEFDTDAFYIEYKEDGLVLTPDN